MQIPTFEDLFAESLRRDLVVVTDGLNEMEEAIALSVALKAVDARLSADDAADEA